MKTRFLNVFDNFRESFWFAPAMISVLSAVGAFGVLRLDGAIDQADMASNWFVRDASAARQILTSVAGTVITLAGIVFSITLVAISMASSQFGSRLLRCFMVDSFSDQLVGLLLGTSLFCYIVLNRVFSGDSVESAFVPQFATAIAAMMGLASVSMLIWFVHDTSQILQAPKLIATVAADLDDAVERLLPDNKQDEQAAPTCCAETVATRQQQPSLPVTSKNDGYIEGVDLDAMIDIATQHNGLISIIHRPGHFVTTLTPIAELFCNPLPDDEIREAVQAAMSAAFVVGMRRTPRQDVTCSIIELVEVADRALSPGVNNPFAAMNCIDRLAAALSRVVNRPFPPAQHFDCDGELRVITSPITFPQLLQDAFAHIRQYGASTVPVAIRLIEAFHRIALQATNADDLASIKAHAEAVEHKFTNSNPADMDQHDFDARFESLQQLLTTRSDS